MFRNACFIVPAKALRLDNLGYAQKRHLSRTTMKKLKLMRRMASSPHYTLEKVSDTVI